MISFESRVELTEHPLAAALFQLMADKQTNLAAAADLADCESVLKFADQVGPHICILKTHVDALADFSDQFIGKLQHLAHKHRFYLFEDRKFADIGNTVQAQYANSIFRITQWADIINAHPLPGPGVIEGLRAGRVSTHSGLLLIAEMSSAGHLFSQHYTRETQRLAAEYPDFVMGYITQHRLGDERDKVHMIPGVKEGPGGDGYHQQYLTPKKAVIDKGADVVIVGRGISQAHDPVEAAGRYRQQAWEAYCQLC